MTNEGEAVCGVGAEVFGENPPTVTLCPPQISQELPWDQTRDAAVGSPRLFTWAMAWLLMLKYYIVDVYKVSQNDFQNRH
jgi:hypothetical protein